MKKTFYKFIIIFWVILFLYPINNCKAITPSTPQPHLVRQGTNLVSNPTFSGSTDWSLIQLAAYDAAVSHVADGSGSINLPYNEGNPGHPNNSTLLSTDYLPVVLGEVYSVSGYLYTTSVNHPFVAIGLATYDANKVFIDSRFISLEGVSAASEWQEIVAAFRPQGNEAYVRFALYRMYGSQDDLTTNVWFDDAYFGSGLGFNEAPEAKQEFNGAMSRIDSLGNIEVLKNGTWESYFPLCVYQKDTIVQADLNAYSAQGFNCTMWSRVDNFDESYFKSRLDAVSSFNPNGMMAMGDFTDYTIPEDTDHYNDISGLTTAITDMMSRPSFSQVFLGYYLDNEQYDQYPVISAATNAIKTTDVNGLGQRNHFIYMLEGNQGITRMFSNLVDSVGDYLHDEHGISLGIDKTVLSSNIQDQDKPFVFGINSNWIDDSADALRSELYQLLIGGGKGLAIYRDPVHGSGVPIENTDAWTELPQLRTEINTLLPLIRQPHWTNWSVTTPDTTPIQVGTRDYNNDGYLFLANTSGTQAGATFSLSGLSYESNRMTDFFTGSQTATISQNQFTITLPPYGTAVYHLEHVPNPESLPQTGASIDIYNLFAGYVSSE
jgi:hypothetical protein